MVGQELEVVDNARIAYGDDPIARFENLIKFKGAAECEHVKRLITLRHNIIFVLAGNQAGKCLTYKTLIDTPEGEVFMGELYDRGKPFRVWAWDGEKKIIANAHPPFKKPNKEPCLRITMSDDRWCEPAYGHRILSKNGWSRACDLLIGPSEPQHYSPFLEVDGNRIISYSLIGSQEVFDFEVPKYHNYFAGGLIHHNTSCTAYNYVLRILGRHPVHEKNRLSKSIRCLSSSLPEPSADPEEQDNTQYLELTKLLPYESVLKPITHRSLSMVVSGHLGRHFIEFRSTKQELQDTGKVQRSSLWQDEESPKAFRIESRRRLTKPPGLEKWENFPGDEIISLTPINGLSYTYDDVFLRASYIWRSKVVAEQLNKPREERIPTGSKNIAVVHIATDDNPLLDKGNFEALFEDIDPNIDRDLYLLRRYGIFLQATGTVHKSYNPHIHFISYDKYFPNGIPYEWTHARGIDYHESRIPWSVGWLSVSPDDEWFLWQEYHPAIDGPRAYTTDEIAKHIARNSRDYYYTVNLIDPLANKKQANTGFSVTEDLNRIFDELRRNHGIGTATYWEGWDTKDTKGRDEIKKRFKNAALVGKPFNNVSRRHGETVRLPTLWICSTCPNFNKSIQRWSYQEWATEQSKAMNERKNVPQAKFSHDPMVLECLAKDVKLKWWPRYVSPKQNYSQSGRPIA